MTKKRTLRNVMPVITLLLIYFFTRIHNILAFPLFHDEINYIPRAQFIREGQILFTVRNSRILHPWVLAFLDTDPPGGAWIMRAGLILFGVLGAAALYGLARSMMSRRIAVLAVLLWMTTQYALFYERLALADVVMNAITIVAVWIAWQLAREARYWMAVALGLSIVAIFLAKASGTPWIMLPVITMLVMNGSVPWRKRIGLIGISYGTLALIWGTFLLLLRWKGLNYYGLATHFVEGVSSTIFNRLVSNLSQMLTYNLAYVGWLISGLAILGVVLGLRKRPRATFLIFMAFGMSFGGVVLFGSNVNSRYLFEHVVWVVLLCALAVGLIIEQKPDWRLPIYAGLAAWTIIFFLPFAYTLWTNPANLNLVESDALEYIQGDASGFGVSDAGYYLSENGEDLPVLGTLPNCQLLRFTAYPRDIECPTLHWDTDNAPIMAMIEQWAEDGPLYVVAVDMAYFSTADIPQPNTVIERFERPGGMLTVELLLVEQGARRSAAE